MSALRMVGVGIAIGMAAALALGPRARELLFQTSPKDAGALLAAVPCLVLVTIAAAVVPAWRASRVSPIVALRVELARA